MPNYLKLHDLISHRVTIEYDTGARVSGYLASCQPSSGPVEFVVRVVGRQDDRFAGARAA